MAWHGLDRWAADHLHWVQGKLKGAYLRFVMADERHLVEHVQAGKYSRQGHVVYGLILRREMVGSCGMEWSTWT